MKMITFERLTEEDITLLLMLRMDRETKSLQDILKMEGSLGEQMRKHITSPIYRRRKNIEVENLVRDLRIDPWDRLKGSLDYWIGTQVGQEDQTYSMLPWLEKAKQAATGEEALRHISDMNDALGGVIPESLDLTSDRWADVIVKVVKLEEMMTEELRSL
jgi:hypothetical protein